MDVRLPRDAAELDAALDLRRRVFCGEQGVALEADRDGRDRDALHLVAIESGRVIGTCRLLIERRVARLGRLAVERERRGRGVGRALLAQADRTAGEHGATAVRLHAQEAARSLYAAAGYRTSGEPFVEEGIPHIAMEKRLA